MMMQSTVNNKQDSTPGNVFGRPGQGSIQLAHRGVPTGATSKKALCSLPNSRKTVSTLTNQQQQLFGDYAMINIKQASMPIDLYINVDLAKGVSTSSQGVRLRRSPFWANYQKKGVNYSTTVNHPNKKTNFR